MRGFQYLSVVSFKVSLTGFFRCCVSNNEGKTKLNHILSNNGIPGKAFIMSLFI